MCFAICFPPLFTFQEPDINTDYCCRDRRKFTHLIAKYTKKLSSSTNYKVAKIDISPGKKALKSIAKERALARYSFVLFSLSLSSDFNPYFLG